MGGAVTFSVSSFSAGAVSCKIYRSPLLPPPPPHAGERLRMENYAYLAESVRPLAGVAPALAPFLAQAETRQVCVCVCVQEGGGGGRGRTVQEAGAPCFPPSPSQEDSIKAYVQLQQQLWWRSDAPLHPCPPCTPPLRRTAPRHMCNSSWSGGASGSCWNSETEWTSCWR